MGGDHQCPVCQATFTRPQHVARHMRSHTGDRPYKCQHCGDQFARSDLLSRHINKCHAHEKPVPSPGCRRKGSSSASRATTSKQACDQCVQTSLPCDGANPCAKCVQRKCRCTYVKFHRQTAPIGPGHQPRPIHAPPARIPAPSSADLLYLNPPPPAPIPAIPDPAFALYSDIPPPYHSWGTGTLPWTHPDVYPHALGHTPEPSFFPPQPSFGGLLPGIPADDPNVTPMPLKEPRDAQLWKQYMRSPDLPAKRTRVLSMPVASRGESSVRTTLHDEDLSSYEAAVLARKAPTHLCLPRRATIPPPPIDPFTVNRDLSSSLAGVFGPSSDLSLQPPLSSSSSSSFHLRQDSPSTSSTSTAPGSSSRASSVATEDDDHPSPHDAIPVDDHHHQSNSIKTLSSTHLDTKNQFLIPDQPDAGRMIMIPSPMDPFAFGMN